MSTVVFDLSLGGILPKMATKHAAAYDVYCPEDIVIPAKSRCKIPLRFKMKFDENLQALIEPRSGFELEGFEGVIYIGKGNQVMERIKRFDCDVLVGKIDSDYRGEVSVIVKNCDESFTCKAGSRIAQLTFVNISHPNIILGEVDNDTERGEGGFGHTGLT